MTTITASDRPLVPTGGHARWLTSPLAWLMSALLALLLVGQLHPGFSTGLRSMPVSLTVARISVQTLGQQASDAAASATAAHAEHRRAASALDRRDLVHCWRQARRLAVDPSSCRATQDTHH